MLAKQAQYKTLGERRNKCRTEVATTLAVEAFCQRAFMTLKLDSIYSGGKVSRQIGHCSLYFIQPSKQAL